MSMHTEETLVNLANNFIGRLRLTTKHIGQFSPSSFYSYILDSKAVWRRFSNDIEKMSVETLGSLVSLLKFTEGYSEPYPVYSGRQTMLGDIEPSAVQYPVGQSIARYSDGENMLHDLAGATIICVMYDILATERVILIENGRTVKSVDYEPRPKMREFVLKHRLKHLQTKA